MHKHTMNNSPKRLAQDTDIASSKKYKQDAQADSFHGNNIMAVDDIQDSDGDDSARNDSSLVSSNTTNGDNSGHTQVKWLWMTDAKTWEEYPTDFCDILEREYAGARGDVKVDNQRFVDLKSKLQRRYDDRNKVRPIKREEGKASGNKPTSKQVASSNVVKAKVNTAPKSTPIQKAVISQAPTKSNPSPKDSTQEGKWYWMNDNGWTLYDDKITQKLERNYISGKKQNVNIDDSRYVDLKDMFQRRYDQPTRTRLVKRECTPVAQKSHSISNTVATSAPLKVPDNKKMKDTQDTKKGKDSKVAVQWLWLSDENKWEPYDTVTASCLEGEFSHGSKEARVDEERYVDLENMIQRRYDNEYKKRYVKRQAFLTDEQKERSERNRLAALEKLKAKGQQSILSYFSTPRKSEPTSAPTSTSDKALASDGDDERSMHDGDDKKELNERRQHYKCGDDYVTLHQIETWEATLLRLNADASTSQGGNLPDPAVNKKVSLWRGDITSLEIDAIVNAAKPSLLGGGGIDGAIHRAAGKGLVNECMLLDGCDVGGAKITSGHKLPASFVIHTVGPIGEDAAALEQCYDSVMDLVAQYGIQSVAFCCVSTGIYGYPNDKAAHVGLSTVRKWLDKNKTAQVSTRAIGIVHCALC